MRQPRTSTHEVEAADTKAPPSWEDIDAELRSSTREAGVGCATAGAMTDSEMAMGMATLREAVSRRRGTTSRRTT